MIDYAGWERIDAHERSAGEAKNRPRIKLVRVDALREAAGGPTARPDNGP